VDGVVVAVVVPGDHGGVAAGTPRPAPRVVALGLVDRGRLVVLLLDVHAPDVVVRAGGDVLGRQHRRVHRVVLVVVPVHAVAADGVDVRRAVVEPLDDVGHVG